MNEEKEGQEAFNIHRQIIENEAQRRKLLSLNVRLLKEVKDRQLYKTILGDKEADWVAYLGDIEIFYSRNEVYNLMRIYDKFIIDLDLNYATIADIPRSRLVELLPIVTKENVEDWLSCARNLTSRDFTNNIREEKGLPTTDDGHEHDYTEYEICKMCGEKHELSKKYEEDK